MKASVAAVVLEYRAPAHTSKCVRALLEQGICDIFVIDNSDDDGATFATLTALLPNEPRLHLEQSSSNLGFAAGVNVGLVRAKNKSAADRVLIINNDAVPQAGLVELLAGALEENVERLIAFPSLMHAGTLVREVYYHRWLATLGERPGMGAFRIPRGCCMMVATERLRGALFDESFFMYGEEIALGWRLRKEPEALCYVPTALAVHEGSIGSKLGSPFYEERTAAAHFLLTSRLAKWPGESFLLAVVRTPAILLRAILRSLRALSLRPLMSLYPAWRIACAADKH